jgi:hypothetical protein
MTGLLGPGAGGIPFESHLNHLSGPAQAVLLALREHVLSLGSNVIEDVRPHRIVYSKTMNFRIFLDVEPSGESIILTIRHGRSAPTATATLKTAADLESAKNQIEIAYKNIQ